MDISTADFCDAHPDDVRVAEPIFRAYGGRPRFAGRAVTRKVFEDNSLIRDALAEDGRGKVLVVDGGGSLRCALVGDQLAALAAKNGWEGLVVWGAIRDARAIAAIDLGVRALATHPRKSVKKGVGERDVPVAFAGVTIAPDDHVYADEDGVIVSSRALGG